MLTPKEGSGSARVWPAPIGWSALVESAMASTGTAATDCTVHFGWKPTAATIAPLNDMTGHYLITIRKVGSTVTVWKQGTQLPAYGGSVGATYAEFIQNVLTYYAGSYYGYFSRLVVVDGNGGYTYADFMELSERVTGLWVPRKPALASFTQVETPQFTGGTAFGANMGDFSAGNAFDMNASTRWASDSSGVIGYLLPAAKTIDGYSITARNDNDTYAQYETPRDFTIQGSNDGSTWDVIDTRTGIDWSSAGQKRNFTLSSPADYAQYRLVATAVYSGPVVSLAEFSGYAASSQTYGFGGCLLDFSNAADLGADASGNGNDWTVTGTQTDDTPTHNGGVSTWTALPNPTVWRSSTVADIVLRQGTGAGASVTSLDFQPDFVDMKSRGQSIDWFVTDAVRGVNKQIYTNWPAAQGTSPYILTAFNTDGYDVGQSTSVNASGFSYIDLCLKAGSGQGFAIHTFTHVVGVDSVLDHGLGKAVTFALIKRLDDSGNWAVFHSALGGGAYLLLNSTNAAGSASGIWATTSTTFTVGGPHFASGDYVAYLFTDSDVFRAFSYIGNASSNGPTVDLGGKPLVIPFLKDSGSASAYWGFKAAATNPSNPVYNWLYPNINASEHTGTGAPLMFTSTGFKVATDNAPANGASGNRIVGLAVIEAATKYTNAY